MKNNNKNDSTIVVVWASGDPYVAERVALMYTHAAKARSMFDEVVLIVWGPSAKVAAENLQIRKKLELMKNDGVILKACVTCANEYNVTDNLSEQGFEVSAMGGQLTEYLKSGAHVLTF
jgi:hypothetical protein